MLTVLADFIESRLSARDETGASTVEWMMLSVVALAVMGLLIVAMPNLAQAVLDFIQEQLGV